jgi:hypothetical protein
MGASDQTHKEGHMDAELDDVKALTTERLVEIATQCLVKWRAFPMIPGSERWARNGTVALFALASRLSSLEAALEAICEANSASVSPAYKDIARNALETAALVSAGSQEDTGIAPRMPCGCDPGTHEADGCPIDAAGSSDTRTGE